MMERSYYKWLLECWKKNYLMQQRTDASPTCGRKPLAYVCLMYVSSRAPPERRRQRTRRRRLAWRWVIGTRGRK